MREDRLRQIIDVVKNVPDDAFNMNGWWHKLNNSCGTAGCAIGWSIEKLGPDVGLFLSKFGGPENRLGDLGYTAVAEVLDITENEAMWMFSPMAYDFDEDEDDCTVMREMVVGRIQAFIGGARPTEDYTIVE